jgi:hypothetical protein
LRVVSQKSDGTTRRCRQSDERSLQPHRSDFVTFGLLTRRQEVISVTRMGNID